MAEIVQVIGPDGSIDEFHEPIPGVYIPAGQDVQATLDRLFPLPFFAALRARHSEMFGG